MYARINFSTLSLMDALDLAMLIEVEAYNRYLGFASQLGHSGPETPGHFFKNMADNEKKHGEEIAERRRNMFGDVPKRVRIDDLFDVEAPAEGAIRRAMSVYEAFEVGVLAEKKAYDFYDQALEHITDSDVRELFIELRDEETEHVELLQDVMAKLPPSAKVGNEIDYDETPFL